MMDRQIRFHWCILQTADPLAQCQQAEISGIESVLVNDSPRALELGSKTNKIKFLVVGRPEVTHASDFVRDIEGASAQFPGRVLPSMLCGPAPSDFPAACDRLWSRQTERYVAGNSTEAAVQAIRHATCLLRSPCAPADVTGVAGPILHLGVEVGFQTFLIARFTHEEARLAARQMADGGTHEWITPWLWTGGVALPGSPPVSLVGSYQEVAQAILNYRRSGISQFLFRGSPDGMEMKHFSKGVLPLVRKGERL